MRRALPTGAMSNKARIPVPDGTQSLHTEAGLPDKVMPAWAEMSRQLGLIMARRDSPFGRRPPAGFRRGIDFYPASDLLVVLTRSALRYRSVHGAFPNLVAPTKFTEHVFGSNYFRPFKCPQTGNKLETSHFLPEGISGQVSVPPVVWRSDRAQLPPPGDIEPGQYYLKTNHGSDMFERIEWPLEGGERDRLETLFGEHLKNDYGYRNGEWWYSSFPREIFLEKSVARADHPIAWCCYTFRGKVGFIIAYRKLGRSSETIWLNSDFAPSPWQNAAKDRAKVEMPPRATRQAMLDAAARIGEAHSFVRVDFLLGDDGLIYLSELTFSPGNATTPLPAELDLQLGALWREARVDEAAWQRDR